MRERVRIQLLFDKDDPKCKRRTMQSFAKECDVNNIMKRFKQTGFLVDPLLQASRKPYFGDFSSGVDYMSMKNEVVRANGKFNLLPAEVRSKFQNDVSKLLDFVVKPENKDEAIKLGLLPPLTKEEMAAKAEAERIALEGKPKPATAAPAS